MKKFLFLLFLFTSALYCQTNTGELRLSIIDPSGLGAKAGVQVESEANEYRNNLTTNSEGKLDVQHLHLSNPVL